MRAARYYGVKDIRVEEVPEPNGDLGPTQVLIAPRQVGICGTDLHEYVAGPIVTPAEPHPLTGAQLPQILGHELSADVVAVGTEVTNVVPGDRISVMPLVFCGKCYFCRRGLNHLCVEMGCFGLSWDWGGMAGLGVVESYQAWPLPDEVSGPIGTSTLFAAWNAAIYVAQIEDVRLSEVVRDGRYLEATDRVLKKHGGLWFNDETYVISRRRAPA